MALIFGVKKEDLGINEKTQELEFLEFLAIVASILKVLLNKNLLQ
jgi:hypothetical protein